MDEVLNSFQVTAVQENKMTDRESFGQFFKEARQSRQISIDELSWATKIKTDYIYAIEAGDLSLLPGEIFTKGYIRSCAKYLCINEEEAMSRYILCSGKKCVPQVPEKIIEAPSFLTVLFRLLDKIKRLLTGREDFQVY